MKWPWSKTVYTHNWEFKPYAFEPGRIYVIELALRHISVEEVKALDDYFRKHGVNVKLVLNRSDKMAVYPIEVKGMTEVLSD